MGAYGILVEDKSKKIDRDFQTSPIRTASLLGGYMMSAVFIGLLMSFVLLIVSEIYIFCCYGVTLAAGKMLLVYGILILTTLSNSSLVLLLVSFLKSSNALAGCCTILGALIGFLTGIYLPMGSLSEGVQGLIKCFPVAHSVVLFRQELMEPFITQNFASPDSIAALEFKNYMGIRYSFGEKIFSVGQSIAVLAVTVIVCMSITTWKLSRKNKH